MSFSKYFALAGMTAPARVGVEPDDAHVHSVSMDGSLIEGCMFSEACWFVKPFGREIFSSTIRTSCLYSSAATLMIPRT